MSIVDRFEEQILTAASRTRQRRRRRRAFSAAFLSAVVIATPTLAQIEPWRPLLGDANRGVPASSDSDVPAEQLQGLAVLRRPQTAQDRSDLAARALRLVNTNVSGVRTATVRVLTSDGVQGVLFSVRRFNLGLEQMLAPDAPEWARERLRPKNNGLCLFVPDPAGDGGGMGCVAWEQLSAGQLPSRIGSIFYGLVPDGVASVRIHTDNASLDAAVHDNFFAVNDPDRAAARGGHSALGAEWLDAGGKVLTTIHAPGPPGGASR
jgi:hypothetical protein